MDNDIENQKFQLYDDNADTSTLRVLVQANEASTAFDNYTKFESLLSLDFISKVYYLQESFTEYY